jgi:hypothetical protein
MAGFVMPWMFSRMTFRWRSAPPLPRPLPPLPRPDIVSDVKSQFDPCGHFPRGFPLKNGAFFIAALLPPFSSGERAIHRPTQIHAPLARSYPMEFGFACQPSPTLYGSPRLRPIAVRLSVQYVKKMYQPANRFKK